MVDQAGANTVSLAPADPHDAADESDYLAAYAGRLTWQDYAPLYRRMREDRSPLSWSFALFFFPWIWLIYRKMPIVGVAVWAVDFGAFYVSPWCSVIKPLISVGLGIFGRTLFVRQAMRAVARVRAEHSDRDAALALLKDQGMAKGAALFGLVVPLLLILAFISTTHIQISFK